MVVTESGRNSIRDRWKLEPLAARRSSSAVDVLEGPPVGTDAEVRSRPGQHHDMHCRIGVHVVERPPVLDGHPAVHALRRSGRLSSTRATPCSTVYSSSVKSDGSTQEEGTNSKPAGSE